jgi:hypothetical protein
MSLKIGILNTGQVGNKMIASLFIFGAGILTGIVLVGIILNLTILKQDKWE